MRAWIVGLILVLMIAGSVDAQDTSFELTILHTNNVIDAHLPGSDGVGGTARAATIINQARSEATNVLLLDGGDRFLNPSRYAANGQIMNVLGYDAMTLGNHEFNGGNQGVADFLDTLEFPIIAANIDFSASPILQDRIPSYTIVERSGQQIAIIGLANEIAPALSSPDRDLVFLDDEVPIVRETVSILEAQGINIIILLAHRTASDNAVLASTVSGVDVIVGGSDNTLLNNMLPEADSGYPIEAESLIGEPILIVQTSEGNRFLGRLDVSFDAEGHITAWRGDTAILDQTISDDTEMAQLIETITLQETAASTKIGETVYDLMGGDPLGGNLCREEECTMGNLITDALRHQAETDIAVFNSGGIRADILTGAITDDALLEVMPFGNTVSTLELTGADVLALLEHSVALGGDASVDGSGRFLQVSGLRFSWNPSRIVGNRIVSVEVLNDDGEYVPFNADGIYSVVTNDFIRSGGDDYVMLAENAIDPFDFGPPVEQMVGAYIRSVGIVEIRTEGRITRIQNG